MSHVSHVGPGQCGPVLGADDDLPLLDPPGHTEAAPVVSVHCQHEGEEQQVTSHLSPDYWSSHQPFIPGSSVIGQ